MKDVKEPEYIFPEDIKPLVAKAPEKRTVTMRLFTENGDNNGDGENDNTSKAGDSPAGRF